MFNLLIYYFKKFLPRKDRPSSNFQYRHYLFNELKENLDISNFKNFRILEIGPRDGEDSQRLASLNPKDFFIIDLPNRTKNNLDWIKNLNIKPKYLEGNFMYLSDEELSEIGKFDLIWFTGVLYHNPEQLRFIKKLYNLLNDNGYLVLESSTVKTLSLRNKNVVQIHYPNTFRDTDTITHLPSKQAIKSWLSMSGFFQIIDSKCFNFENLNIKNTRYACIAIKTKDSKPKKYYSKVVNNSNYEIGDSH